jgi:hypothetical protein
MILFLSFFRIHPDLRGQLLRDWSSDYTIRTDYPYSPSLDLNPIFDLPRMQATRIFQVRLGHSYLLAHPIWLRPDPANCPRCDLDLETTEHAILHCPERQYVRDLFPKDLDLDLAWMSPDQLKIIGDFIIRTQTGYPPPPTPPQSPPTPASQASPTPSTLILSPVSVNHP